MAKKTTKKVAKKAVKKTAKKVASSKTTKKAVSKTPAKKVTKKKATKKVAPKATTAKMAILPPTPAPTAEEISHAAYLNYKSRQEQGIHGDHEGDWHAAVESTKKSK